MTSSEVQENKSNALSWISSMMSTDGFPSKYLHLTHLKVVLI